MIRQPLVVVLGHVDHGKTKLLDSIRGTAIAAKEAGGITQCIGCSYVPLKTIKTICGSILTATKTNLSLPGLLFIDSPGHAAFTNLRKRGGNLADIAILVVDINEGFKPQTVESIEILKQYKTPFIVVANKVDLLPGWRAAGENILENISSQAENVQQELDKKLYELVGKLSEFGINSERFDRVEDYTNQIAIVPCSAKTREGIPAVLMVLSGLAQKYLEECLTCKEDSPAKGVVLEVKKERGLGMTIDVIVYDGTLKKGSKIVIGGLNAPIVTKVKAMFEPKPLSEMRDSKSSFKPVEKVTAATGVKISAIGIETVVAGAPVLTVMGDEAKTKEEAQKEVEDVIIETEKEGVVVKADTLGSLEALTMLLKEKGVQIRSASIGQITRKDVLDAESNYEKDPLKAVVLGFNVSAAPDAESPRAKIITQDVVYRLIEEFEKWRDNEKKMQDAKQIDNVVRPCKIQLLKGYVFRQNNPAVSGVEVLSGKLKVGTPLMKGNQTITSVKSIQEEKESVNEAEKGKQVAISMPGVTIGRQLFEGDTLYSSIPEEDFRRLKNLKKFLEPEEKEILREIAQLMRADNPMWGI
ncbi:MAG: translation initiation factor IF-2 [bacterium]|nr:translation initiation factor IF-2 [bacterium]